MRIIARFNKEQGVRFVSHLDVQRLFQRAFRRADIPVAYSNGFNPHQQLSFATALTVGATSSAEWLDIKLDREMTSEEFTRRVNEVLPRGFSIAEAFPADDRYPSLSAVMAAAEYTLSLKFFEDVRGAEVSGAIQKLLSDSIVVLKKTKAGMKNVDIRPMVYSMEFSAIAGENFIITLAGRLDAAGGLNADLLLGAFKGIIGKEFCAAIHRETIYSSDGAFMPKAPAGYPIQA
ncbi:MAG: DUF2344 domain-containing protein [Clostridia bacterium]|nr:DUF2344 domain-containing protein [Clostridia bacterium]